MTTRGMLILYHADGSIWGTFPPMVRYSPEGLPIEIIDWEAREAAGLPVTDLLAVTTPGDATNPPIKGAKHWPEGKVADLREHRVELAGKAGHKHIAALVHKTNGRRRERAGR
jgi:hypothetical protein